jgi:hypothetical protein
MGQVDQVHELGSWVYGPLIKPGMLNPEWTHEIRTRRGPLSRP